jgi:hypothetical protein
MTLLTRRVKALALLSLAYLLLPLHGQTSRGTISGLVTDASGSAIPSAIVTLIDTARGTSRETNTNESGVYRFDAVEPSIYRVEVKAGGFTPYAAAGLTVAAAQVLSVDARLEVGQAATTVVEVSASAAVLQTEQPIRGGTITSKTAVELPVASRNPVSLVLNLPGVSTNRGGTGIATFSVNGGRGRSNNFMLDGTENNDISVNGQAFQITNPDAIQEVSAQLSNFDAEFGRAGGGVINTIIKSGTNEFHGTASYLLESTRLNAITNTQALSNYVIQNRKPIPGTDQWFAGTFGGPIIKNRTFFFGAFQERRTVSQSTVNLTTLSEAGRARLRQLFPSGTNANVDTYLTATAGNAATSQFSNIDLGSGRGNVEIGTFIRTVPSKVRNYQPIVKVDHRFSDNNLVAVRWAYSQTADPLGGGTNFQGLDSSSRSEFQNAAITWTRIFSPRITNEFRLPFNRITFDFPLDPPNELGVTLPNITVQGLTVLGVASNIPQGRIANNYGLQDTISVVQGRHTMRFGLDLLLQRARQAAPYNQRGSVNFLAGGGFTGLGNFVDNFSGNGASAARDFGSAVYYPELFRQAFFFQDRWRLSQSWTVSMGVRYEYFGLPMNSLIKPAFSGLFNVNPTTYEGPFSQPNEVRADRNNFGPNVGIAFSPSARDGMLGWLFGDRKTSIRAGYMIGYESFFNNIASNAVASTPNLIATNNLGNTSTASPRGVSNWSSQIPTTSRLPNALDSQTLMLENLVNPYYQRFNFSIQRQLPQDILLDIGYVGSRGVRLFMNEDLNPQVPANLQVFPQGTTAASFPANRLQQRFDPLQGSRQIRTNGGSSTYHAMQLDVNRSFRNGLLVRGAYTWSKFIDNSTDVFAWGGGLNVPSLSMVPTIFGGLPLERGLSVLDRTQRFVLSWVYELPFAKSQRGVIGHLIGGWQISGVGTFESGVPYTISNGLDADGLGGAGTDRPDLNPNGQPGVRAVISTTSPTGYVNPENNNAPIDPATARYIQLPTCTNPNGCRPGTAGRNTERSPGIANWNVNFQKSTLITERWRVELRGEFFNLFNHPQFGNSNSSAFAPGTGTLGANLQSTLAGRFMNPFFQDGGSRVVRLQLKIAF